MKKHALVYPTSQTRDIMSDPALMTPTIFRYPNSWSDKTLKTYLCDYLDLKDHEFDFVELSSVSSLTIPPNYV